MTYVVLFVFLLVAGVIGPSFMPSLRGTLLSYAIRGVSLFLAFLCAMATSVVRIPADQVGVVHKLYGAHSLEIGHLIATKGETGWQAEIISPGAFMVSPFYNVLNEVVAVPLVNVPQGFYGRIVAVDGQALESGQIMAPLWSEGQASAMTDAGYFLTNGGRKGLQASILLPGKYALNLALFQVRIGYEPNGREIKTTMDDVYGMGGMHQEATPLITSLTRVPAGFVGVVRSTIADHAVQCGESVAATAGAGLVARLVPRGCVGIWTETLSPGDYYLNRDAYDVTLVDTRVQTLEFKGGYSRRIIDLKVDQRGDYQQTERVEPRPFDPKESTDTAVNTKVEGWEVPQELRVVVQVQPQHAPTVVAAVGGVLEIERRILVPSIRSQVRNVLGSTVTIPDGKGGSEVRPTRVLDLVEQRQALESTILALVAEDGARAGVDVKEIRLGESAIPPELLLARQREQLAQQLSRAYEQERAAQVQRQSAERARATADQQGDLVKAQIAVQTAEQEELRRAAQGRAERAFLEEQAKGQAAQVSVLGQDAALRLQMFKLGLDLLGQHPDMLGQLRLPSTVVVGSTGLEGPAAVLGGLLGGMPTITAPANRTAAPVAVRP